MAGIYIHIPFCKSRCIYCGFYSTTALQLRQDYTDALCAEMRLRHHYLRERVHSIYIGGGTPSMLEERQLRQIFAALADTFGPSGSDEKYTIGSVPLCTLGDCEVTIECNPDDVTDGLASLLRELPVNRVSMGAQTFSDQRLAFLSRRHRAADVGSAVSRLRQAGIKNISIDLMYGFPGETLDEWHRDIDTALALNVEHLSAYALQYEEGTPLYNLLQKGQVTETDEELSRHMYYDLKDRLEAAGYEHYEISNFARPGFRSRHNSSYWNQTPYLGLGAAAHSFDGKSRQWNVSDIKAYIRGVQSGDILIEHELLNEDTRYNELVMTRLRTCEGLPLRLLTPTQRDYCLRQASRYLADGLLQVCLPQGGTSESLRLTRRGIFVSDMVMADLMWA